MKKLILLIGLLLISTTAFAQNLPPSLDYWYLQTSDNIPIYVVEGGQGDSVIVLHGGWGADYSYLVPALRPLFDKYHFIFYDQRGSLRSPAPDSTISLQRFVQDLEDLREELGIKKVTLLSHSMGSILAYAYLRKYPQHVKGLVLTDPVPPKGVRDKSMERLKEWFKKRAQKEIKEEGLDKKHLSSREKTKKWKIRFAAANIYHLDRWPQMRGGGAFYSKGVAQAMYKNTPDSLFNGFKKVLIKYHKPSFVIVGDHDEIDFGLKVWPNLAKNIPNMELLILKNAGHCSWIDRPGKFHDYVDYALTQINKK